MKMIRTIELTGMLGLAFLASTIIPACSDEYILDRDNIDMTVNVGGEAFAIPLGTTDTLMLSSILEIPEDGIISIDGDGNYFLSIEQDFSEYFDVSKYTDMTRFDGVVSQFMRVVRIPAVPPAPVPDFELDLMPLIQDNMETTLIYSFDDAVDAGLVRIDSLLLEGALISPEMTLSSDNPMPDDIGVRLVFSIPERLCVDGMERGKAIFEGKMGKDGTVSLNPLCMNRLDLNTRPGEPMEYIDVFSVDSLVLTMDGSLLSSIAGSDIRLDLSVKVGNEMGQIVPYAVYGLVDLSLDPVYEGIDLSDVPELLKNDDIVLDFYNPVLRADISTNSTIPVAVDASFIPYFNYEQAPESSANISFTTPFLQASDVPEVSESYTWGKDVIGNLLKRIPDNIMISIFSRTDADVPQHYLSSAITNYFVGGRFMLDIPFAFGEEVSVAFADTITNLPDMLGKTMTQANISLKGEVQSTFPVDLQLNLVFLDENMEPLDINVTPLDIASCSQEGVPELTPLDLSIAKNQLASGIKAMAVEFRMLPGKVPGMPVNQDSYVYSSLFLAVPGGLTVDLNDTENESY